MINDLISPNPEPPVSPLFPTPWTATGRFVYDANETLVDVVELYDDYGDDEKGVRVAAFIAEAVNEKIARDSAPTRSTLIDGDGDTWTSIGDGRYYGPGELSPRTRDEIASDFGIRE